MGTVSWLTPAVRIIGGRGVIWESAGEGEAGKRRVGDGEMTCVAGVK